MKHAVLLLAIIASLQVIAQNKLEVVAKFPDERPGNIAVSQAGRIFITMSALTNTKYKVREVLPDGATVPFPKEEWAAQPGAGVIGINAAIGIRITPDNTLWVLDMGNPNVIPRQNAKLVGWDVVTRQLSRMYIIPEAVLNKTSFLQDFIIDTKNNIAVIADMTQSVKDPINPAFVILNLKTGCVRRVLENDPSFLPLDEPIIVDGVKVLHKNEDGSSMQPRNALNPIAIDKNNNYVYYGAMGAKKIFRIPTTILADEKLSNEAMAKYISYYAEKPKSDGFTIDDNGSLYVTDIEHNAVGISNSKGYQRIISDPLLSWPDGVTLYKGYLYVVANQLYRLPILNNGVDASKPPYHILRIRVK